MERIEIDGKLVIEYENGIDDKAIEEGISMLYKLKVQNAMDRFEAYAASKPLPRKLAEALC